VKLNKKLIEDVNITGAKNVIRGKYLVHFYVAYSDTYVRKSQDEK